MYLPTYRSFSFTYFYLRFNLNDLISLIKKNYYTKLRPIKDTLVDLTSEKAVLKYTQKLAKILMLRRIAKLFP